MNILLEQIYSTGIVKTADGEEHQAFPTGVNRSLGDALYRIVRENNLKLTLEVGMAFGVSTLAICQALRDNGGGKHVVIDPLQSTNYKSIGMLNLKRAGLDDLIEFYEQPSHLILPDLVRHDQKFELVFIDGNHLFDYVIVDVFYSQFLVSVGGQICLDDIDKLSVSKAFAFIVRNLENLSVIDQTERFCILRKVAEEDDRAWDHFKEF